MNILFKKLWLISLVFITALPLKAKDGGSDDKKSKGKKEVDIKKNTVNDEGKQKELTYPENISNNVSIYENEELEAHYYISQSLPKSEKVSKKQENVQRKISRKIIKKERKECRKLQKVIKKNNQNTVKNQ